MRHLARFAVAYPITVTMAVLAVILLGYISFRKLGMEIFPDLNNPRLFVELTAGERPPEEIEKQFLQSMESQAIRQKGVVRVSSTARVGSALMVVEFAWNTNMDEAFLDLQKGLRSFSSNQDIDELLISQQDPNASPIILLGFSHPEVTDMDELRRMSENYIRNELIRLKGIAEVKLLGAEEKEVLIQTDSYRMKAYNVTSSGISNSIQTYNRNVSGGSIVDMGTSYVVKGVGELRSLDEIGSVVVTFRQPEGTTSQTSATTGTVTAQVPVYLRDVANISLRNKDPENIVRVNGRRCMGIAIYKETRYNTVNAVREFMGALDTLKRALPGYEFTIIRNQGEFVANAIGEVKQSALIGILLSVIVLYVFLRRFGATLIIATSIPISIIATFNLMYFHGLTLNIMTLGGLALGAGMLVDNAIIVVESIFRNIENGVPLLQAVIEGTGQVGGAITASTITTIIVFLPIVYLQGSAGELFKDQAWTVSFSLISSLAVAALVIPMLSSRFLTHEVKIHAGTPVRYPRYRAILDTLIKRPFSVVAITAVLVGATFLLLPRLGSEFIPKAGARDFTVEISLPEGTTLVRTAEAVETMEIRIREALGDKLGVIYSVTGPSENTEGGEAGKVEDENTAIIKLTIAPKSVITPEQVLNLLNQALANIPDAEIRIAYEQTSLDITLGTESAPLVVEIKGEDIDTLKSLTEQVKTKLAAIPDIFNVRTSFDEGRPEIEVKLDRIRAGALNVGVSNVSSRLTERLTGTSAGEWESGGELRDITIELPKVSMSEIGNLPITSGSMEVPLSEVAQVNVVEAPTAINRRDQSRIGTVSTDLRHDRPLDHVVREIRTNLAGVTFPPGYQYSITGEEEQRQESFANLKFALLLSILLMYMVLASQFESLIHPFTIMLAIPTALVGTILLFLALGIPLNIMAYIGIIMLGGIAVNDSIVLVDAILQLQRQGMTVREAVLEAGQRRLRPIIMTTLTTVLAMLPLTIGIGEGAALRSPMALAVIGGLVSSTILTLAVIPCVYVIIERAKKRLFKREPAQTGEAR
jgi:HAE1 family hydrophobic/amphiphilic exporter-1